MAKTVDKEIDCADTLTDKEVRAWYNLLWAWINSNDMTYDIWEFVRDNTDGEYGTVPYPQQWEKGFMSLLEEHIEEYGSVDDYEKEYHRKKQEHKEWKENGMMSEMDLAIVNFITSLKVNYEHRKDDDATIIMGLLKLLAKSNRVKFPNDSDEVDLLLKQIKRNDLLQ